MLITDVEKFSNKFFVNDDGCWEWVAGKNGDGYGAFHLPGEQYHAHRVSYELIYGDIPEGLQIDHLCRNHSCVNPYHLEAVTQKENMLRGVSVFAQNARKTHCPQKHEYTAGNTYMDKYNRRYCRKCRVVHVRNWRIKQRNYQNKDNKTCCEEV